MVARGGSQLSSSISIQEKGSRNKRKFRADPPLIDPKNVSTILNECHTYEFPVERSQNKLNIQQNSICDMCRFNRDQHDASKSDLRSQFAQDSFNSGCDQPKEELERDEFQDVDWSDLTENQLEELVLSNLDMIFKGAIKKITSYGYSEVVATKAILRSGLCYGCKDTVSNIADNTLAFLSNGKVIDTSRDYFFDDLQQLERYVLAEMVCLLREVRPFFTTGDAMWCLLICDMNVSHACAMDGGDPPSSLKNAETKGTSFSAVPQPKPGAGNPILSMPKLNLTGPKKLNSQFPHAHSSLSEMPAVPSCGNPVVFDGLSTEKESLISSTSSAGAAHVSAAVPTMLQPFAPEMKFSSGRKCQTSSSKRQLTLRQKTVHLEKHYRACGAKASFRTGKLSNLGGLVFDKKCKPLLDSTSSNLKNVSLGLSRAFGADVSQANGKTNLSNNAGSNPDLGLIQKTCNGLPELPAANIELSLSLPLKGNVASGPCCSVDTTSCSNNRILPDKILGQLISHDKKDELLLKLVPCLQALQSQIQGWTEWAQEKVMQAAHRLSKDRVELKTLKKEKEEVARINKEKEALEDNTMKKLMEMENALSKASGQVDRANAAVRRLEMENSELKQEMEAAKSQATESAANCQEVSSREKKTLKKFESWEWQKAMIQEELATEKQRLSQLQQHLEQARLLQEQLEAKWRQEEEKKKGALSQSNSERSEREWIEASAKLEEDTIRLKAENDLQRYQDEMQRLENEISQLRGTPKIAKLQWGTDGTYAFHLGRSTNSLKEIHMHNLSQAMFFHNSGVRDVQRERECVMCLTEEMTIVFLPCAHQVVCIQCNDLHEKQGMKDCPSCRAPIQRRVRVRFAHS